MNQKGFAHILFILILLAGIGIAVYLTQFTQVFKPKAAGDQTVFYVSPAGNDTNDGSANSPFKTIDRARLAVRTVNKSTATDIYVYIKKGTYQLSAPIIFEPDDSGLNGHYIRYISETPADRPLIHGGKVITGWIQEGNKWKVNIGTSPLRQLYMNNQRIPRARTHGGLAPFQYAAAGLTYADDRLSKLSRPSDSEVVINHAFYHYRCPVESVTGISVNMKKPCWDTVMLIEKGLTSPTIPSPQPIWLENAFEFLTTPGEWYHNKQTGDLYYLPKSGEQINTGTFVAPKLEKLIEGKGTEQNPIHNIVFQNLDFAYSTYLEPGISGYLGFQGVSIAKGADINQGMLPMPGNIQFTQSNNVWFVRNGFYHLGAAGINFERGSKSNFIIGNVFNDISAHAIILGDNYSAGVENPPSSMVTDNNQIQNNYINDVSLEYQDTNGIYVGYSKKTNITHNVVFNVPYSGISVAFETIPAYTGGNMIAQNDVYDFMKGEQLYDGGGIYLKGMQPGTQVVENVIHGQKNPVGGIYLDAPDSVTVSRNVVYDIRIPATIFGYPTYGNAASLTGCGNVITNNYWQRDNANFVAFVPNIGYGNKTCTVNSVESSNTTITSLNQAPQNIVAAAGLEATYQDIKNFPAPLLPSSASPSPTASAKPGDTDNDGDVDIFDYNLVLQDFGKTNDPLTKADLDNDNDVDIFDYNIVVGNFGK